MKTKEFLKEELDKIDKNAFLEINGYGNTEFVCQVMELYSDAVNKIVSERTKMETFIERDFLNGDRIDYDKIESIFKNDEYLLSIWAYRCGVDKSDDRCVYGWPDKFEYFYHGYMLSKNQDKIFFRL